MKHVTALITIFNTMCVIFIMYFALPSGIISQGSGIEYKDLVSILLTLVTIILAALAILLAVAAVWGYNTIKDAAERAAIAAVQERADVAARETAHRVATDICPTIAAREAQAALIRSGALEGDDTDDLYVALSASEQESRLEEEVA